MFWLNFGTFTHLDKSITQFNWKGGICGSKSTELTCQIRRSLRLFWTEMRKVAKRDKTNGRWDYTSTENESILSGTLQKGCSIDGSEHSGPVWSLCRGRCQIRHQPPLMTFLRLLRITGAGAWSRREGGGRERARPRVTSHRTTEPDKSRPARGHQLFLLHSPGMRTRPVMCGKRNIYQSFYLKNHFSFKGLFGSQTICFMANPIFSD